jgi:hypothetical protein
VHAHPVALVAFSICRQVPDTRLFHQAHFVCGQPGFAPYALPGSGRLGENIAQTFAAGCDCVILENHGVVVGGQSLSHAFQRFEAFEFAGKTVIKGRHLGEIHYLSANDNRYGLAGFVFTRDLARGLALCEGLEAGSVWLNDIQRSSHYEPFGGVKESGLGREKGRYGVESYLEWKTMYLSFEVPK